MDIQQAINQLEDLQMHCISFKDKIDGEDSVWHKDVQALRKAIEVLRKQIPETVIRHKHNRCTCPNCYGDVHYKMLIEQVVKFCPNCGQKLD